MTEYINHTIAGWLVKDERVYVDDPSEVPQGAKLETGPRDGMYYKPSSIDSFNDYVETHRAETFADTELHPDHPAVEKATALAADYDAVATETYQHILSTVMASSADIKAASYRTKDPVSMAEKIIRKDHYDDVAELGDIFGTRIYASGETIHHAVEAIQDQFGDQILDEDNYIENPKDGYYRAYHMNFEFADGKVGEVQLKIPEAGEISDVGWKMVYKADYDFGDDVSETEVDAIREEVADCLTASMDMVMGEDPSTPGCTRRATEYIREFMGYT